MDNSEMPLLFGMVLVVRMLPPIQKVWLGLFFVTTAVRTCTGWVSPNNSSPPSFKGQRELVRHPIVVAAVAAAGASGGEDFMNGLRETSSRTIMTESFVQSTTVPLSALPTPKKAAATFDQRQHDQLLLNDPDNIAHRTRDDFTILRRMVNDQRVPLVYLDSAATSQKPQAVIAALQSYYQNSNANVHRGAHTLSREATAAYEAARDTVASLINAPSRNEIIFTSGATEAINLVAQSYGRHFLQPGDEVVLTVAEHHANLVPWQMLASEKQDQVVLKFTQLDPVTGTLDLQHFQSLLTPNTKFVAFQHVSNVLGTTNPVQDMVNMVRAQCTPDVKILLDACQSVPHMPVSVQSLGVDFLVASGHKMCGPTGIGFLWGREDLLNAMPPWKGGGEMIDTVTLSGSTWQKSPGRFEAGTPAIAQAVGLAAAIDYLQTKAGGMQQISDYEHALGRYLCEELIAVPDITILGPQDVTKRGALCAFVHKSIHPSDMSAFLDLQGVAVRAGHHCCQPLHTSLGYSHSARASCSFYNTKEDIDAFIQHLKETIQFFESLDSSAITTTGDQQKGDGDEGFVPFI